MGKLNKTTEKVNELLEKVEGMPEKVKDGKTPVLETGTTTTLDPGQNATSEVVANGTDDEGNPKYKLNFGIPKGYDGAGGSGGGGVADSVQWANVLNKPSWVNSATKPEYTASEVGALPASTTIPSKTSQLKNDSGFTTSESFKTINGQSIVGSGNIVIESGGTPSTGGGNVNVTNGSALDSARYYAFKPSADGSLNGTFGIIPNASESEAGLMSKSDYFKLNGMKQVWKVPLAVLELTDTSTSEEIESAFGMEGNALGMIVAYNAASLKSEYSNTIPSNTFIGNLECLLSGNVVDENVYTLDFNYVDSGKLKTISITYNLSTVQFSCKLSESGGGADDTYYLPTEVFNIQAGDTIEKIKEAFGGDEGLSQLKAALKAKKKICIYYISSTVSEFYIPVYTYRFLSTYTLLFRNLFTKNCDVFIQIGGAHECAKHIYPEGYTLNPEVYFLNSNSTSDEISAAVGGESGLKAIIQALKDGNRVVIRGTSEKMEGYQINQDLMCNMYQESDNGDIQLYLTGFGFALFGGFAGLLSISYTKSSNEFSCKYTPING